MDQGKHIDGLKSAPQDAVGVICFRGHEVLLIKRGKPPRKGDWSLPGGRVERGERFEDAALRELLEETGVTAKLGRKIATIDADFGEYHYMLHDYIAEYINGVVCAADDATHARFFAMDEITALKMWPKTEEVVREAWEVICEAECNSP